MEDILSKLNDLLSSKEGQQKIAEVSKLFSSTDTKESAPASSGLGGLDLSALAPLLSSLGASSAPAQPEQTAVNDLINPAALASVVTALSKTNTAGPETTLLLALKPFLKNQRTYRVDEALKIMKLLALLPMIRESGILEGIL